MPVANQREDTCSITSMDPRTFAFFDSQTPVLAKRYEGVPGPISLVTIPTRATFCTGWIASTSRLVRLRTAPLLRLATSIERLIAMVADLTFGHDPPRIRWLQSAHHQPFDVDARKQQLDADLAALPSFKVWVQLTALQRKRK